MISPDDIAVGMFSVALFFFGFAVSNVAPRLSSWRSKSSSALRNRAEEAASAADMERLGRIYDNCFSEIYVFSSSTYRFVQANRGARESLGYDMAELREMTPIDVMPEHDRQSFEALLAPLLAGKEQVIFRSTHQRKQGCQYPIEVRAQLSLGEGEPVYAAIVEDITERRNIQRQLVQSQKLESIGQLAAGIAHEINTPAQYVGDNTRFLKEGFRDLVAIETAYAQLRAAVQSGESTAELIAGIDALIESADLDYLKKEIPNAIEQSLGGILRISHIVNAMKEFSHPSGNNKEPVDINRLLENTATVASNEWKYVADMKFDFAEDMHPVNCFPQELGQVILSMIVNAAHAIESKSNRDRERQGTITLRTIQKPDCVEIQVEDTGIGITDDIRDKVFDPFFTTKDVGKGTGQGLSVAHTAIVEQHQGAISFETRSGVGTTFFVTLPIAVEEMAA